MEAAFADDTIPATMPAVIGWRSTRCARIRAFPASLGCSDIFMIHDRRNPPILDQARLSQEP
jgi:hypothetical protein